MAQPSLSGFLARYPEFGCVKHALIISVMAEAPIYVDSTWGEYEVMGAMLYTAHNLAVQGQGDGMASRKFKSSVTSITSGSHKVVYSDGDDRLLGFEATPYGQQFLTLQRSVGVSMVSVL